MKIEAGSKKDFHALPTLV